MKNKNNSKRLLPASGFTLIEFLLAMMLGVFLLAGISTVYVSSKKTYSVRDQTSALDESARMALRALKHHIAHAGYVSSTGMHLSDFILPTGTVVTPETCADGDANVRNAGIIASSRDRGVAEGGDTIGLSYMADTQLNVDCSGRSTLRAACLAPQANNRADSYVYNSFMVDSNRTNSAGDPIPDLRCAGSLTINAQPWAEGVENIQFQYGVDSNADGAVDNYWNATNVANNNLWGNIIAVRVGLLMRSVDQVFDRSVPESFQVLDQLINTTDRYRRNVYTTTIRLKNVARRVQ